MVLHGFNRGTEDIDLLVDRTIENIARLREALSILPDNAVREVRDTDVEEYGVVRVADDEAQQREDGQRFKLALQG